MSSLSKTIQENALLREQCIALDAQLLEFMENFRVTADRWTQRSEAKLRKMRALSRMEDKMEELEERISSVESDRDSLRNEEKSSEIKMLESVMAAKEAAFETERKRMSAVIRRLQEKLKSASNAEKAFEEKQTSLEATIEKKDGTILRNRRALDAMLAICRAKNAKVNELESQLKAMTEESPESDWESSSGESDEEFTSDTVSSVQHPTDSSSSVNPIRIEIPVEEETSFDDVVLTVYQPRIPSRKPSSRPRFSSFGPPILLPSSPLQNFPSSPPVTSPSSPPTEL